MKKHYQDVLFRTIASVILVPMLVIGIVLVFNFYQRGLDKVENNIEWESKTAAASIYNSLLHVKFDSLSLANNEAIVEVTRNILLSQYVSKELQAYVEQNQLVEAALIMDDSDFVIEAYPYSTLKIETDFLSQLAHSIMVDNPEKVQATLNYIDDQAIGDRYFVNKKTPYLLAYIIPLQKQNNSIVNPHETTGILVSFIDISALMSDLNSTKQAQDYLYQLAIDPISQVELNQFASYFSAASLVDVPVVKNGQPVDLRLEVHQNKSDHHYIFVTTILTLLFLFVVFLLVLVFYIKRFSAQINRPLIEMIELSRQFATGNYQTQKMESDYAEFDELMSAMQKMANKIDDQVTRLTHAKQLAEQSEKSKSQFLANMSHEIRTPMNGVLGMLQLVAKSDLNDFQAEWVKKAEYSAKNLLTLLNDILDFSKIEAGKMTLEITQVNLHELLDSVLSPFRQQAREKGLAFDIHYSNHCPPVWLMDPTRFNQILINLCSNALKFTEQGKVEVVISQVENFGFRLKVSDTGIGMTSEQLNKIFNTFEQADPSTTRKFGGTGLGLAICKGLAELMGGEITVHSEIGQGCSFSVLIKAEVINQTIEAKAVKSTECPDLTGRKILVAEDNEINQEILKYMLETTQAEIILAGNGKEALDGYHTFKPDIILMDVQMPEMDGVEATRRIRELDIDVPIIMQTANVMPDDIKHYTRVGANACIDKPIDLNQLYCVLTEFSEF